MSENAQEHQSTFSVPEDVQTAVNAMADDARRASRALATADRSRKDRALIRIAEAIDASREVILRSNSDDVSRGREKGLAENLLDRLTLNDERIDGLIEALHNLASQVDPIGEILDGQTLPNGLRVSRVRVPLGVVGAIYEARPNVTVDIAGLALKSGNAAMLRGGSAALETNKTLVGVIRDALDAAGLPMDAVQSVDEYGRDGANALMLAQGKVDVLIPRGGGNLIQSVVQNARVPVIETGEGNVHIYLDDTADAENAVPLVVNSKIHRPSACNSAETLLIQKGSQAAGEVLKGLLDADVRLHVDDASAELAGGFSDRVVAATDDDWDSETLALEMSVKVVDSMEDALEHIQKYSTGHTELIITNDLRKADEFVNRVDSATVMVNASTRFTDGGELGLGAEVGISTQKLHARGPMGLAQLTSSQWVVRGQGHVRG
ncbi:glutamate-5-semialdehyde dehydrogenase [Kocuria sp. HSID16901]|uniref:glutamate-5-semialdehyde dehydrogenase n=1 Tax=Kocuria sp. HSID16901 TaxID=2419505 RepID=UPI00066135A8|nr:glutamate-5-semialdehyde dehydrogenase [Kocuria sp. HSID16901]RUQ22527.1 glutamate-5-semialdehyde dehydrogenase [Kocuria sp. HSID16901]